MLLKPISFMRKAAAGAAAYTDSFTYSDGELQTVSSSQWLKRAGGDIDVISNEIYTTATSNAVYSYDDAFANDHYSEIELVTLGGNSANGAAICVQTNGDCIFARWESTRIQLRSIVSGSETYETQITGISPASGWKMRLEVDRATEIVSLFIDQGSGFPGTADLTHDFSADNWLGTGEALDGGQAGIVCRWPGAGFEVYMDNWAGGDV